MIDLHKQINTFLVYRSPYNQSACKFVRCFSGLNLKTWIEQIWRLVKNADSEEDADRKLKAFLGTQIYGFWLLMPILEENPHMPDSVAGIAAYIRRYGYCEEVITNSDNFIQVLTDDDELELAFYLFDSEYLIGNKKNASYLAIEGFELPEMAEPIEPSPYGLNLFFESHWYISMLSAREPNVYIPEIGLKDLPVYLLNSKVTKDWRIEILLLRALSIDKQGQPKTFDQMMQDFLSYDFTFWEEFMKTYEGEERAFLLQDDILAVQKELEDKYQSFVPKRPFNKEHGLHRIQRASNLFQVGIFNEDWETNPMFATSPCYVYDHWIFFESSWAEEYPDLASSIDRYFSRWDCLE